MPATHDSVHNLLFHDTLLRIEINPPLPCGIDGCGRPARCGQVEPDPRCDSLWSLLPICETHLVSLAAAAPHYATREPRPSLPPDD